MAYRLIWSPAAQADVEAIEAYIAERSPLNARHVVERLGQAALKQCEYPFAARMVPEFSDPTRRETFVYEYRLMFRIEGNRVRVMRVVHGRRLLSNVPGSFEETAQDYRAA